METKNLTPERLTAYRDHLYMEERADATIEKYMRDIRCFISFLPPGKEVTKEAVLRYKKELTQHYRPASANSMLTALNGLFVFLGWPEFRVRLLRIQHENFRRPDKELTKEEYFMLLRAARQNGQEQLFVLMQAICSTGIRVSEHKFLTAEAVRTGYVSVINKGKVRTICLPAPLRRCLSDYCARRHISSGPIFVTRFGNPLDRSNIWSAMKKLCRCCGVEEEKVYPHNLRHLFAVSFYDLDKDLMHLADLLGHSSVETTRIYTSTTGREQQKKLARMKLVI